jgi:uncharacterized repeat protein (TIGR03803 family)
LLQASSGNFYGCTFAGLNGSAIFQMTPSVQVTTFYTFPTSYAPAGPLIQGSDGNFYGGAIDLGPTNGDFVFQISPSGAVTTLHAFNQATDGHLSGALVQGPTGYLYGMTSDGGTAGDGIVFELSTDGSTYTVLHNFGDRSVPHDGKTPIGSLVVGADNNLYGATQDGGSAGLGTVFKISP